jgi:hypothetical protein
MWCKQHGMDLGINMVDSIQLARMCVHPSTGRLSLRDVTGGGALGEAEHPRGPSTANPTVDGRQFHYTVHSQEKEGNSISASEGREGLTTSKMTIAGPMHPATNPICFLVSSLHTRIVGARPMHYERREVCVYWQLTNVSGGCRPLL